MAVKFKPSQGKKSKSTVEQRYINRPPGTRRHGGKLVGWPSHRLVPRHS